MAKWDTEAAFLFWFNEEEPGLRRTMAEVAERFRVSRRTVERAASEGAWAARAREVEAGARAIVDQRLVKTIADRNSELLMLSDALVAMLARRLIPSVPGVPNPDELKPSDISVRDFLEIGKFVLLLQGQATERVGSAAPAPTIAELEAAILEDEDALAAWEAARAESARTIALIEKSPG